MGFSPDWLAEVRAEASALLGGTGFMVLKDAAGNKVAIWHGAIRQCLDDEQLTALIERRLKEGSDDSR